MLKDLPASFRPAFARHEIDRNCQGSLVVVQAKKQVGFGFEAREKARFTGPNASKGYVYEGLRRQDMIGRLQAELQQQTRPINISYEVGPGLSWGWYANGDLREPRGSPWHIQDVVEEMIVTTSFSLFISLNLFENARCCWVFC